MKSLHFRTIGLAVLIMFAGTSASQAAYTEIQCNSYDGAKDMWYDGTDVVYQTSDSEPNSYNVLTLKDDAAPGGNLDTAGIAYDVSLVLTSTFQNFDSTVPGKGYFTGGVLELNFKFFDYTYGITSHTLRGPVTEGTLEVTSASPTTSEIVGIFLFDTNHPTEGIEQLPGYGGVAGIWPATGESGAINLTFALNTDLSAYQTDPAAWNNAMPGNNTYDTQFSLVPEEVIIPEPAALVLGLFGVGGFVLRRPMRKQ